MPRHHMTSNGPVPFTSEEETARNAEIAQWLSDKPMNDWLQSMAESDAILPRWAEDMLDAMNASDFANVDQVTKDKLTAKKNMRSQKPA